MIRFRQATLADVDTVTDIESGSWPAALAAPRRAIVSRISVFAAGQWLAVRNRQIVGVAFAQRIRTDQLDTRPLSYARLTGDGTFQTTHADEGAVYQLVGVGVRPEAQGFGAGRRLIDRQLEFARSLHGIERIVGFTRPVGFHKYPNLSIDEYVVRRSADGRIEDPVLSFHLDSGAQLVSVHPEFRSDDRDARGWGVLIEYPV
ncbi:MAG: GNAT family N-acetyltransferase [Planctomycetaceae bacterium]